MHLVRPVEDGAVVALDRYVATGERGALDSLGIIFDNLYDEGRHFFLLDMSDVHTVPSVFLATLVTLQNRASSFTGVVGLLNPSRTVQKLLSVTLVNEIIPVYFDEAQALEDLRARRQNAVEKLRALLTCDDKTARLESAKKLARGRFQDGFDTLVLGLRDPEEGTRLQALRDLAALGGERVISPLLQALKDSSDRVREHAVEALAKSNNPRVVESLRMVVRYERNRNVYHKAVAALEKLEKTSV